MTDVPIKTTLINKNFGNTAAVNSVNLTIESGTIYGLLGRNGAGKTTLLRLILGILKPSNGNAKVFGQNFASANEKLRQRVAYIGQDYRFFPRYTLNELVNLVAPLYEKWNWDKADRLLNLFELDMNKRLGEMSGGQRQKAAMLVAFSCGAELLVLDEPASALDPVSRRIAMGEMMSFVTEDPEKNTIIFSTHIVNDLERVATKVGMMNKGKITHEFELDNIHDNMRKVQIVFHDNIPANYKLNHAISYSQDRNIITAIYDITCEDGEKELSGLTETTATINKFPVNLEDFFVEIFGKSQLISID